MKQTTWEDFMTAIAMITVILIIVCSISGAAMPYVKGEKCLSL